MRDLPDDIPATKAAEEPRGRAALGLSPNGMFYDWVVKPMGGRGWTLAATIVQLALTVFTGVVLVVAVYALTR